MSETNKRSGSDRPKLGYIVGSHVVYGKATARLLRSMLGRGNRIDPSSIIVQVNGSGTCHRQYLDGIGYYYVTGESKSHFWSLVNYELGENLSIDYWLYLNCTSECGKEFRNKAEAGFSPSADASLAGAVLPLADCEDCKHGRAINDLAVYKYSYLLSQKEVIETVEQANTHAVFHKWEGYFYGAAPKQAVYPQLGYTIDRNNLKDIYGTGILRATEYYPGIDLYRFKRNFGQLSDADSGYDRVGM